jgi:hypothetical protein
MTDRIDEDLPKQFPCSKCEVGIMQWTYVVLESKTFIARGCNKCPNGYWEETDI